MKINCNPKYHDCENCIFNTGSWNSFNPCGIKEGYEPCVDDGWDDENYETGILHPSTRPRAKECD